jgi:DinB superfamily
MITTNQRPDASEYIPYYERYIGLVPDGAIVDILARQFEEYGSFYRGIGDAQAGHRYAPGKWSIKQVMGHVIDTERIFNYRALSVSRGEKQTLPGFEQDDYVAAANFDDRRLGDLVDELAQVRAASITLFQHMTDEMLSRRGSAWRGEITARACGFLIAGHERYHVKQLRERYLSQSPATAA